jgi:hypothetical protein
MGRVLFTVSGLVLLIAILSVYVQHPVSQPQGSFAGWTMEATNTKPIISLNDTYSYEPTALVDMITQSWKVWFCGGDTVGKFGDSIFYTVVKPSIESASEPMPVLRPQNSDLAEDGRHTCSPSVIRHSNINIERGDDLYILYYECARRFYDRGQKGMPIEGFTQICLAFSEDGIDWHKYNEALWNSSKKFGDLDTNPTPVISVGPRVLSNCKYAFINGQHTIDTSNQPCSHENFLNNYGVGHPSAIVMNVGFSKQSLLYYLDSMGDPSRYGVYVARSWDGFHFDAPVRTNIPNDASIKYYARVFGNWNHVFVATTVVGRANGFALSEDGIHWMPSDGSVIGIGNAVGAHCAAPGPGAIVGDENGNLSSLSVNILSPEGYLGTADQGSTLGCYKPSEDNSRGSSWKIYLLQGRITARLSRFQ